MAATFVLPSVMLTVLMLFSIHVFKEYSGTRYEGQNSSIPQYEGQKECGLTVKQLECKPAVPIKVIKNSTHGNKIIKTIERKDILLQPIPSHAFMLKAKVEDALMSLGERNFLCVQEKLGLFYPQAVSCGQIFLEDIKVPYILDDSIVVILFYCLVLSQLREEQIQKVPLLMSYFGVSHFHYFTTWMILQAILSCLWSTICCAPYFYKASLMHSSMALFWIYKYLNFITVALFALMCSKFVKGTVYFLACVIQILLVYLVVLIMSFNDDGILCIKSPLRFLFLLHPIVHSKNFELLSQQAEYSKIGLHLNSMGTYFHDENQSWRYFGTIQTTILTMPLLWILFLIVYCADFELYAKIENYFIRKRRQQRVQVMNNCHNMTTQPLLNEKHKVDSVLSLNKLTKIYKNDIRVVDDLSLTVSFGEVLGLLGKNGAGKSTTMNMIAGFTSPTWGSISVNGFDSIKQWRQMKRFLSFCPQENLFFSRLSVIEHLKFACLVKGNSKYRHRECIEILKDLRMDHKRGSRCSELSGGEKRRVCVAMAYVANTPLVLLDEPTSGVDPATRKLLWLFIQKYQEKPITIRGENGQSDHIRKRAVVLSTHFMEEADSLAQRIAIVAFGQLRAIGSPNWLKSKFSIGYRITCLMDESKMEKALHEEGLSGDVEVTHCDDSKWCQLVLSMQRDSAIVSNNELMSKLFTMLERNDVKYSLKAASLEDVFIKLTSTSIPDDLLNERHESSHSSDEVQRSPSPLKHSSQQMEFLSYDDDDEDDERLCSFDQKGSVLFSLYVDGFLLFRNSWRFFFFYTLLFFVVPSLSMLLAAPAAELLGKKEYDTATVNLAKTFPQYKILLIDVLSQDVKLFKRVFPRTGAIEVTNVTRTIYDRFYNDAFSVYSVYPFFIKFNKNLNMFRCIVNMNWAPSYDFCLIAINNYYHFKYRSKEFFQLEIDYVVYNEFYTQLAQIYQLMENDKESFVLKGQIYTVVMPFLLSCLVFYLMRIEQQAVFNKEHQYYRANGRSVVCSVLIRMLSLATPIFIFSQSAILFAHTEKLLANDGKVGLLEFNFPVFLSLTLFSLTTAAFVLLYVRCFYSMFSILIPTIFFSLFVPLLANKYDVEATELNLFMWPVVICAYLSPISVLGCIFNWNRHAVAFYTLSAQFVGYFFLLTLHSLLVLRKLYHLFNYFIGVFPHYLQHKNRKTLKIYNLRHTYQTLRFNFCCRIKCFKLSATEAVRSMTFEVAPGKCYALLGVNGSGKSTIFELITGGLAVQRGCVTLNGCNVSRKPLKAFAHLGYCPQFDTVPQYLTVGQLINAFLLLRHVCDDYSRKHKLFFIDQMELKPHLGKLISQCSGGTKRKLCTVLAFIGFPKVIILDESTTGMDPVIRKNVANLISAAKKAGSVVLISSHTMEEVENIADIICIMRKGCKRAEGSALQLREDYGKFFTLSLKLNQHNNITEELIHLNISSPSLSSSSPAQNMDDSVVIGNSGSHRNDVVDNCKMNENYFKLRCAEVEREINNRFPGSVLTHKFQIGGISNQQLLFTIPKENIRLSEVFSLLAEHQVKWGIEESMLNVCTLENIFMHIALEDEYRNGDDDDDGYDFDNNDNFVDLDTSNGCKRALES